MMVFCMFGHGSWGVAIVSTPSAGHANIKRISCAYVTGYGMLLQGLVTYHTGKSMTFLMAYLYIPCLSLTDTNF